MDVCETDTIVKILDIVRNLFIEKQSLGLWWQMIYEGLVKHHSIIRSDLWEAIVSAMNECNLNVSDSITFSKTRRAKPNDTQNADIHHHHHLNVLQLPEALRLHALQFLDLGDLKKSQLICRSFLMSVRNPASARFLKLTTFRYLPLPRYHLTWLSRIRQLEFVEKGFEPHFLWPWLHCKSLEKLEIKCLDQDVDNEQDEWLCEEIVKHKFGKIHEVKINAFAFQAYPKSISAIIAGGDEESRKTLHIVEDCHELYQFTLQPDAMSKIQCLDLEGSPDSIRLLLGCINKSLQDVAEKQTLRSLTIDTCCPWRPNHPFCALFTPSLGQVTSRAERTTLFWSMTGANQKLAKDWVLHIISDAYLPKLAVVFMGTFGLDWEGLNDMHWTSDCEPELHRIIQHNGDQLMDLYRSCIAPYQSEESLRARLRTKGMKTLNIEFSGVIHSQLIPSKYCTFIVEQLRALTEALNKISTTIWANPTVGTINFKFSVQINF